MTSPMDATMDVTLPGRVWSDALAPAAGGAQGLELPPPTLKPYGRGFRVSYVGVELDRAEELADFLIRRAPVGFDVRKADIHRESIKTGKAIRTLVRLERERHRRLGSPST
jgi:hypothetical protein